MNSDARLYFLVWLLCIAAKLCVSDELPTCLPKDYHYEFTECDKNGGRWRVSVPKPMTCIGGIPNPPTRVNDCRTSCDAGTYFNRSNLECVSCPPGTYSLGGGIKFDSWDHLPSGFHTSLESFESSFRLLHSALPNSPTNCSGYGWKPQKSFISSPGGPCAATLTYSVKLVKPGAMFYTYQYTDPSILFNFEAQNDQCQSIDDVEKYKWPRTTEEAKWRTSKVQLKAGLNVLYWKTVGMGFLNPKGRKPKPIRIKKIEISGVAYTSECTPCEPGTYSSSGSKICTPCQENTYSSAGASECTPCNKATHYSARGSAKCLERPLCTKRDYYQLHSPCDSMKYTRIIYKWVEPKICRDDAPNSVTLPTTSETVPCPPCNPGMENSNKSMCEFCPKDYYSDGSEPCMECPPSTAPNYGLFFHLWPEFPPGMYARCMSLEGGCMSNAVWQPAGDHVRTTTGDSLDAYLVLSLDVPGFRGKERLINGQPAEIGRVTFTFELLCTYNCNFVFTMGSNRKPFEEIESWSGRQTQQHYSFTVTQNDSYTFSWAFQKLGFGENESSIEVQNDAAILYEVNVINTVSGGASECEPCPQGTEPEGFLYRCIPCPPGNYLKDVDSLECLPCPSDTYLWQSAPEGPESCKSCGPGLRSEDGQNCYSDCKVYLFDGTYFDLTTLPKYVEVKSSSLFTAQGTQYYHVFNISLCGDKGKPEAVCMNNVTYHSLDPQQEEKVNSFVCRATVVPSQKGGVPLVTQSVSLGDSFIGITSKHELNGMKIADEFIRSAEGQSDIHFFYSSPERTQACMQGRSTTITLRCDESQESHGVISPPNSCSDGTCDGCNFHFLWRTRLACRVCTESDYKVVRGECVGGQQTLHYISPQGCILPNGSEEDVLRRTVPCTAIPREMQILIAIGVFTSLLLTGLLVYCWKRNRKLEFKYMKLIQSNSSKDVELPAAESCAIDDDEEEHFDSVAFSEETEKKKTGLFGKFRTIRVGSNGKVYSNWEEADDFEGSWTPSN